MSESDLPDWDALVERHALRVFRVALRIVRRVEDAEDVSQEVFAEAYRLHQAGPVQSWTGLLVRLATLRSLDRLRRTRPTVPMRDDQRAAGVEPFAEAEAKELAEWLSAAVARLPDVQAAAFVMHFYEQMPRHDIAGALGVSPEAVSTALYKARQCLLAQLAVFHEGDSR
jgi:RNA polymerase sigma-70 factor, ECF subfamily